MFKYEEFAEYIQEHIKEYLEPEFDEAVVKLEDVRKNNGIMLKSLLINVPHRNAVPSMYLYLESYYDDYMQGVNLDLILKQIGKDYMEGCEHAGIVPADFSECLKDFNFVKERITVEIINTQQNLLLLQNIPYHIQEGTDLSYKYGVYLCSGDEEYIGKVLVTNELMKVWNVTIEDIHDIAIENTKRLFPTQISTMTDILCEMFGSDFANLPPIPNHAQMYVITNSQKCKGASAAFIDKEALLGLAEKLQDDLFILPSSIHECIVLAAEDRSVSELMEMVKEVNSTQVLPEDYLSDHVYFYEAQKRTLTLAHTQELNQQSKHSR